MNSPLLAEAASDGTDQPTLRKINLNVVTPQLIAIVGRVGCGKSSLLQAVLGDIPRVAGHLDTNGKIAYAPQSAWLVNDTLRNNITFGQAYDDERYWNVVKACELVTDLRQLPYGDLTEIGEKGVNLSGGQKQRISLARAVYADADLILLDDCLSAVDQYVGRQIFENCIKSLLRGKVVLFVTNQLQYLSECDSIVVIRDGEISASGTFDELDAKSPYFSQLVKNSQMERKPEEGDGYFTDKKGKADADLVAAVVASDASTAAATAAKAITEDGNLDPAIGRLIEDEDRQTGGVGWRTYVEYFRAGGIGSWIILAILFLTAQASKVASDWFVTYYIDIAARLPETPAGYYLGVWSLLLLVRLSLPYFLTNAHLLTRKRLKTDFLRAPGRARNLHCHRRFESLHKAAQCTVR
jgi:ABC-type multidrug transport system ATPase subunit